jgi:serine/threonine-protein kinase
MGEVYRARDTKLKRDVALKVLPLEFATDRERLARFQREAEVLASLNHSNIAHIHGIEESTPAAGSEQPAMTALVMELVEGQDLSQRIARGPIPLDEAVSIAKQIADALEAAHEQGIIHRDLKPANVKVRDDGVVKVLDFGLAKAMDPNAGRGVNLANPGAPEGTPSSLPPTMTSPAMTAMGMILGTAAYMSPEQAKGRAADRRADIWAFGVVLYEMLSGRQLFDGDSVAETIGFVTTRDPDWSALPASTPPSLRRLLARCLTRDPKLRLRDIGEARIALADAAPSVHDAAAPPIPPRLLPRAALIAGTLALIVVATGLGWYWGSRTSGTPSVGVMPYRAEIVPTPANAFERRSTANIFAFTPDGGTLIYASTDPASRMLYRRERNSQVAVPIAGTEGAYGPFVSADGASLGFFANGAMRRVPIGGGAPQMIHDMRAAGAPDSLGVAWASELGPARELGYGATWLQDNGIVYGRFSGGLWRTSATGGNPSPLTKAGDGEIAHRLPRALPGGRAILCTVIRDTIAANDSSIEAVDLATGARTLLMDNATDGRYASGGFLLFARRGALYSVRFDATSLKVSGEPVQISDDVMHAIGGGRPGQASGAAQYEVSPEGMLAVISGGTNVPAARLVVWVERGGKIVPLSRDPAGNLGPRLSPDGARIALRKAPDIVVMDARDGISTPLLSNGLFPVWSHDSTRVLIAQRTANGRQEIYGVPLAGGAPEVVVSNPNPLWPSSVSSDGKLLAYVESNPVTGHDIWVMGLSPRTPPVSIVATPASEGYPMFSPDGRWIVYAVEEAEGDANGIYLRPFPGPGRAERIAGAGATAPIWSRDGSAILYGRLASDGATLHEIVRIAVDTRGERPRVGPTVIFAAGAFNRSTPVSSFDVTLDGLRILTTMDAPPAAGTASAPSIGRTIQLIFPGSATGPGRSRD